jgi:tetratricopeptide (TPR) repeat protein
MAGEDTDASEGQRLTEPAATDIGSDRRMEERIESVFLGVLLFALTICVFIPAFNGGFMWGDDQLLTANPQVHSPDGWWTLWLRPYTADYFPLTSTTFWLEWQFWHMDAMGYHVINVLLHGVAVVVTWLTLERLRVPGAWVAAAIFAVHPVCVESVAWIAERTNLISQIFLLLTIIGYVEFEEKGRERYYAAALMCFTLALLAKESVVMLPFILMLLMWWRRGKVNLARMIPFFIPACFLGLVAVYFQFYRAIGFEEIPIGNWWQRIASACFASGFYLYSALWPLNIIGVYPEWTRAFASTVLLPSVHTQPPSPDSIPYWLQALPGLVIAVLLIWCWLRRTETWARAVLMTLGSYIVALLPVLGLVTMSFMRLTLVADHYQYISIIAVIGLVVAAGNTRSLKPLWLCAAALAFAGATYFNWKQTGDNQIAEVIWIAGPLVLAGVLMWAPELWKYAWSGFLAAVICAFCFISWRQAAIYQSEEIYWTATLKKNPNNWQGHNHLGAALYMRGDVKGSYPHFAEAVRLKPENPESHNNLGLALSIFGQMDEAIKQYEIAVAIKDDTAMRTNLANAYAQVKQYDKAIKNYLRAIELNDNNASAHCNLGFALMQEGKTDEAIPEFMRTIEVDPQMPQGRADLAQALRLKGIDPNAPMPTGRKESFDLQKALELLKQPH